MVLKAGAIPKISRFCVFLGDIVGKIDTWVFLMERNSLPHPNGRGYRSPAPSGPGGMN